MFSCELLRGTDLQRLGVIASSDTASESTTNFRKYLTSIAPGELLEPESLQRLGTSHERLPRPLTCLHRESAKTLPVNAPAVSADTDLRLCRVLGLSPGYWLRAQAAHDTEGASAELAEEIERIEPLIGC